MELAFSLEKLINEKSWLKGQRKGQANFIEEKIGKGTNITRREAVCVENHHCSYFSFLSFLDYLCRSALSSGSLYGALIGSVLAFKIADFIGRRGELITSAVLYLVGALITAIGPNFVILMIGRFIYGIGIGLAMPAAPMYISETAPSHLRGRVISLKEFKGFLEKIGDL